MWSSGHVHDAALDMAAVFSSTDMGHILIYVYIYVHDELQRVKPCFFLFRLLTHTDPNTDNVQPRLEIDFLDIAYSCCCILKLKTQILQSAKLDSHYMTEDGKDGWSMAAGQDKNKSATALICQLLAVGWS